VAGAAPMRGLPFRTRRQTSLPAAKITTHPMRNRIATASVSCAS
jgi:hypothetical protein